MFSRLKSKRESKSSVAENNRCACFLRGKFVIRPKREGSRATPVSIDGESPGPYHFILCLRINSLKRPKTTERQKENTTGIFFCEIFLLIARGDRDICMHYVCVCIYI